MPGSTPNRLLWARLARPVPDRGGVDQISGASGLETERGRIFLFPQNEILKVHRLARPRKPANVLALTGAFRHDPARGRARAGEPQPAGDVGGPPSNLTPDEARCWNEITDLAHAGSLGRSDRLFVEHGARLLSAIRSEPTYDTPALMLRLESVLGKLGLTPVDRSRVSAVSPKDEHDPYAEFTPATDGH